MSGGSAGTQYSLDNGASWQSGTTVAFPRWKRGGGSGIFTVFYRSTDAAGNTESTESTTVMIDNSLPVSSATLGAEGDPTTVILTATDPDSGVSSIWYALDDGDWTQAVYPGADGVTVSVSGPGAHTLSYYAVDNAGNAQSGFNVVAVTVPAGDSSITAKLAGPHRRSPIRLASRRGHRGPR